MVRSGGRGIDFDVRLGFCFINGFARRFEMNGYNDLVGRFDRFCFGRLGGDFVDFVDFDELVGVKDFVVSWYEPFEVYFDDFCSLSKDGMVKSMGFLYGDVDDYGISRFLREGRVEGMRLDFSGSKITDDFISGLNRHSLHMVEQMYLSCSDISNDGFEYLLRKRRRFRWLPDSFGQYEVNGLRFWGFTEFDAMNEFYRSRLGRERCYLGLEGGGCCRYYNVGFELEPSPKDLIVTRVR